MYAIALTSIPPRLARLGPVLASLLAQDPAPARVLLCLPPEWARYAGDAHLPVLPDGVEVIMSETDFGPATKAIASSRALGGTIDRLIYCDDDWLMPPGWAASLLATRHEGEAVAASGWSVERLKRRSTAPPGCVDIAQGFSGVLIDPRWLAGEDLAPPPEAWAVDDIWLSGQLARQGIAARLAKGAREGMTPAFDDTHALQDAVIGGRSRHEANLACIERLTRNHAIWPAL
ncbi:hypothetical protein [Roseovarius indicus]|uniref:hypothetical protein n=1 Tax=Roseovarius indicus TaxID=540747 RepID=UPI0007D9262F|nr:hypothetical protein [Roseovarius indicus]OAO01550.1 hypothetical protein A8B76_19470 [Roseovarius indicus]